MYMIETIPGSKNEPRLVDTGLGPMVLGSWLQLVTCTRHSSWSNNVEHRGDRGKATRDKDL